MDVAILLVVAAVLCAGLSFSVLAGIVSLLHRLIRGRFLGLLNAPTAIALGVYTLLWVCFVWFVASNIAVTH